MSTELTSSFTASSARDFTNEMKADYASLQERISAAYEGQIWNALGYDRWEEYLDAEFADISLRPPKEIEDRVVAELRGVGMSPEGIASATELSRRSVSRKLQEWANAHPEQNLNGPTTGRDGKTYRNHFVVDDDHDDEDIVDAEIVEDEPESPGQVSIGDELGDPRWSGDHRSAEDMGLTPVDLSAASADHSSREYVRRQYGQLLGEAGGGIPAVNAAVNGLAMTLAVTPRDHKLHDDELTAIASASADSAAQLAELLNQIARAGDPSSSTASFNATTVERVDEAIEKLESVRATARTAQ